MNGGKMKIQKAEGFDRNFTYQWNVEDEEPTLKITKSSYGSFKWCPKKYEFSYIDRLPQDTSEAMIKGTVVHNSREDFFDDFDITKAENLSNEELITYNMGLHPVDDYTDIYRNISVFEANRFMEAKEKDKLDSYLPVINEVLIDAELFIPHDLNPKCILQRDYTIHIQGIVDRMFIDNGGYVPLELKTGPWKDYKRTSMRQEMGFYKLLIDNAPTELLEKHGIDRNIPITHWGWHYPVSNYLEIEEVKKTSIKAVYRGITQLIKAYEDKHDGGGNFPAKYYFKTCQHCSFMPMCDAAQAAEW